MNEDLNERAKIINDLFNAGEEEQAIDLLDDLAKEYPNEGIVLFLIGKAMIDEDEEAAMSIFDTALKKGYDSSEMQMLYGLCYLLKDNENEAEKHFDKAAELSEDDIGKLAAYVSIADMYLDHRKYLKAEKLSKTVIAKYPDNYTGYHMHIAILFRKGQFEDALNYLKRLPDEFYEVPRYLTDYAYVYSGQGKIDELIELFNTDERFNKVIPQSVLRYKYTALKTDGSEDDKRFEILSELASEYFDTDALTALMFKYFDEDMYYESSELASAVMKLDQADHGPKYHLALYFQIFNYYALSDKKPSPNLIEWMKASSILCVAYAEKLGYQEITDEVRKMLNALFKALNITDVKL